MNILFLIGGLILILLGANGLTDGAASVAKRLRIPSIVIGLTIVAFGTSAPELTVSVSSALKGSADIAIGNVVGSNIFNTLMIVGCTALFAPIVITRNTLKKEIPLCILSSVVLLVCANDVFLDKAPENILNRVDGLLLLCFFAIFMGYTFAIASKPSSTAGGTSLPELATSIVAALKKNPEIAIGNVIGSNLFNIFFVLGCSASITPLHLSGITNFDLLTLVGSCILLWLFGLFFAKRTITRIEGSIMILCYVAYTVVLIYNT